MDRRAWWVVGGALACQMGLGFTYMYGPLLPEVTADLGWSRTQFNAAIAPRLWVQALASPLFGLLVVRVGARAVLTGRGLCWGGGGGGRGGGERPGDLLAWNLLLGLVLVGVGDVTVAHVVAQWVQRSRAMALGVVYTGSNLGGVVVLTLVTRISEQEHWREAFLWTGLGGSLFLLPFAALFIRAPRAGEGAADAGLEAEALDEPGAAVSLDLRAAARTRSFWILAFLLFAYFFYTTSALEHTVSLLMDLDVPRTEAAGVLGGAVFLGVVGKLGMGAIATRMRARHALALNVGMVGASALCLLATPLLGSPLPFALLFGLSYSGRDVIYPLVLINTFGVRHLAPIYGCLMLTLAVGGVGGPIFTAAVRDQTGSYAPAFAVSATLMAVAFALIPLLRRELTPPDAHTP